MSVPLTPRDVAQALGGDPTARGAIVPGPGHSPKDRSLSVVLGRTLPEGFLVYSHGGDDHLACRDYVRRQLRLPEVVPARAAGLASPGAKLGVTNTPDDRRRRRDAVGIWDEASQLLQGTLAARYWRDHRGGLEITDDIAGRVLRFHPAVPWREASGNLLRVPCLVAALRSIATDELTGVQLTRLNPDTGQKIDRRMRGVAGGSAIKFDADADVTYGLFVGEGAETVQTHRQLGLRPAWALGSAGALEALPVLVGVQSLTLFAERDASGRNAKAIERCAQRWQADGREVIVVDPPRGTNDANDALQERTR